MVAFCCEVSNSIGAEPPVGEFGIVNSAIAVKITCLNQVCFFNQLNLMAQRLRRILIVDDDADCVTNLSDILSDIGYETVTACSGPVALEKIDEHCPDDKCRFDLCLLDFKMPGMDGVELLQEIQARQPQMPSIMITAYAGEDGDKRAIEAGTIVMRKPVDIQKLLGMIDKAVAC